MAVEAEVAVETEVAVEAGGRVRETFEMMGAWGHGGTMGRGGVATLLWIGNAHPHATEPAHAIGIARAKITAIVRSWHERRTYTCARLVWRIARRTSQGPETVQWADGFRTSPPCPHAPMPPSFQKSLTVDPYHQAPRRFFFFGAWHMQMVYFFIGAWHTQAPTAVFRGTGAHKSRQQTLIRKNDIDRTGLSSR